MTQDSSPSASAERLRPASFGACPQTTRAIEQESTPMTRKRFVLNVRPRDADAPGHYDLLRHDPRGVQADLLCRWD